MAAGLSVIENGIEPMVSGLQANESTAKNKAVGLGVKTNAVKPLACGFEVNEHTTTPMV